MHEIIAAYNVNLRPEDNEMIQAILFPLPYPISIAPNNEATASSEMDRASKPGHRIFSDGPDCVAARLGCGHLPSFIRLRKRLQSVMKSSENTDTVSPLDGLPLTMHVRRVGLVGASLDILPSVYETLHMNGGPGRDGN